MLCQISAHFFCFLKNEVIDRVDALFKQAKELKQALSDFVFDAEGDLAVALETFSAQQMSCSGHQDMNQKNLLVDRFIVEGRVGDKTPIDLFLEEPNLSKSERSLVSRWKHSMIGLFAIAQILEDGFELMNWTTAKHYVVKPNDKNILASMARYKVGEILLAQIAPVTDDDWMFFGSCTTLGKLGKPKLAVAIGNFKQTYKNYLYSDAPELLEQAWRSVEQYHQEFIDFFGSDEITLPGYQLSQKLAQFQEKTTEKRLEASGIDRSKSLEELAESAGLSPEEIKSAAEALGADAKTAEQFFDAKKNTKMVPPQIELPARLKNASQVTALTDARWGQMFLPTYEEFKQLLEADDWKTIPNGDRLVRQYLESSEINVFVWQRLASRYPIQLEAILQEVLERPEFNLKKDFQSLMQEFNKPLEAELPDIASVPLHLHELFQEAVLEVSKNKSKDRVAKQKNSKGFQK